MLIDTIPQGADYFFAILYQQGGTATVLTGCTARLQARRYPGAEDLDLELTTEPNAGLTITEDAGRIDGHIANETTTTLSGTYVVQLELTWPDGRIDRVLDGTWDVSPEVVR